MQSQPFSLDLGEFQDPDARVFAARRRGDAIRRLSGLDVVDREGRLVVVTIPDETYTLTTGFFLGLFGPSIRHYGGDGFLTMYHFKGMTGEIFSEILRDCIRYATNTQTPL